MPRMILAGGGNKEKSKHLDQLFLTWLPETKPLLYIPIAMSKRKHPYDECYDWISSVFEPLGFENIDMITNLKEISLRKLRDYGGVYIGGGNTYDLLYLMRKSTFIPKLKDYILRGNPVYGGSAGACIMGKNIISSDNNETSLEDYGGLDLINGYSISCHYNPSHDHNIENYVSKYHIPVLAIPEESGLVLDTNKSYVYGYKGIVLFNRNRKKVYANHKYLLLSSKL